MVSEQGPDDAGVFVGQGHCGFVPALPGFQRLRPSALLVELLGCSGWFTSRAVDQQGSQVAITAVTDDARYGAAAIEALSLATGTFAKFFQKHN